MTAWIHFVKVFCET